MLHNDLPTIADKLEWKLEVHRIATRLKECSLPHVLGVHGEWGSGKTSFMRQVQFALGGNLPTDASVDVPNTVPVVAKKAALQKEVVTIWFDAWRYQNEPVPIVALLNEMRAQMQLVPSVKEKLRKLGTIVAYSVLDSISDIGKILSLEALPSVEKIEKRGEQWEKENYLGANSVSLIREHLCKTIEYLLPKNGARAVIFIDDLDRCNPKSAIRLLEGLKIYLSIPQCVFVLGMNERILVDAIRDEISSPASAAAADSTEIFKIRNGQLRAAHYLEKICSDIYRLPVPRSSINLFANWITNIDERYALMEAVGDIPCLPPNPRRLKALSNQWERFAASSIFPKKENPAQKIWAIRVLIVSYIYQFHRDIWERWHFNPDFWGEISKFCMGESAGEKPGWSATLAMTHTFSGFDDVTSQPILRPVFPNPGDIDNFWIGSLIRKYNDQLTAADFKPLLIFVS